MGTENDLPGISLKDEQRQLQNIIGIAQDNLDRAKESVKKLTDDLEDLRDVYEAQDKEGLALWNNATAQLHENERNIVRCEKARKKPYFGRIDFKDPRQKSQESYYIAESVLQRMHQSLWSLTGEHRLHPYIMRAVLDHVSTR